MTAARLGIVLVNWNRWSDTIECLESVLRSTIAVRTAVVDNASSDNSLEQIAAWAAGKIDACAEDPAMGRFSSPQVPKPIALTMLDAPAARSVAPGVPELALIDGGANLGFAGGNNLGIVHLLQDPAITHIWLLNNDTVVEADAAAALLAQVDTDHGIGMCGTVVRFYHRPDTLQCLNGSTFNPWTGNSQGIGMNRPAAAPVDAAAVARKTDFVLGASLAVSRRFVETVGLMEERYFLYYEEVDWAYRNRGVFNIGFARGATVYHKEGGSIGSSSVKGGRSAMSEYWLMRARMMFVRSHLPLLLPVHWLLAMVQIGRRLVRRQPGKARVMLQALFGRHFQP